jgi:AcrR family transcriptional regulator
MKGFGSRCRFSLCGRGEARRQAFLDAAAELFLEKGFERTSLTHIVCRAGGSRSTLYEQFGGKDGLLKAMIEDATARVWQAIRWDDRPPELSSEGLSDLGGRFVRAALAPDAVAVYRIVVAEGHRFPEIAQFFFDAGPSVAIAHLTDWFSLACQGRAVTAEPEQLARIFLGALLGDLHVRQAIGLVRQWTEADLDHQVDLAVKVLLRGISPP